MKHTTLLSFFTFLFFIFSAQTSAADAVHWDSSTHVEHYLDVNGDGVKDLLLQAASSSSKSALYLGKQVNFSIQYHDDAALFLEAELDGASWTVEEAQVVPGYFNDDAYEDALVVLPALQKAYLLMGEPRGMLGFRRFQAEQFSWLKMGEDNQYYTGDFNGDDQSDLLVLMNDSGAHQLYHSLPNGDFTLAQKRKRKSRWGLKKAEALYIADFNGDGRDDIFALSKKKRKKHYLALANEKGVFKRRNTQVIKADFTDFDWTGDGFSSVIEESGGVSYLVRLYNSNGGIDEEGRFIPDETDTLRHKKCRYVYFMPHSQESGTKCELKRQKRKKRKHKRRAGRDGDTGELSAKSDDAYSAGAKAPLMAQNAATASSTVAVTSTEGTTVPENPPSAPVSSVGAYPAINQPFTLSWAPVADANKYEIWVSYDRGQTQENTYHYTSGTSFTLSESTEGSRFYYIQACNAKGCSPSSPYRSVYIYNIPQPVTQFVSSIDTVPADSDVEVSLSWSRPDGLIGSGGYYKILETNPNGVQSWVKDKLASTTTSATVQFNHRLAGQYNYKIYSCNKTSAYCSGPSPYEVNVSVLPSAVGQASITNLTYTPVVAYVGQTQRFNFDYENATWCYSHNYSHDPNASVTYIGGPNNTTVSSSHFSWSAYRAAPATWTFDVTCYNRINNSKKTQKVSTIIHANRAPIAYDDSQALFYDQTATIRVLDNDIDADGHALAITSYTQPSAGSVNCSSVCTYTAPSSRLGNTSTSFFYTVSDGWGGTSTAQVSINVITPAPDPAPTLTELHYFPQIVKVGEEQMFSFSYTNVRECKNSLGVDYVLNNGQLQSGTFSWGPVLRESPTVWDFTVTCYNSNGSVTVPVYGEIQPAEPPVANPDEYTVEQYSSNNLLSVLDNDTPDGDLLSIVQVGDITQGQVAIASGGKQLIFAPQGDFVGTVSFVYTIEDGAGQTSQSTVTVTVGEVTTPNPGLIAEYLFEDASNLGLDTSGRGNHGTIDRSPRQTVGKIGMGMHTTYGALKQLPGFNKGQVVTINFWFKTSSTREFLYLMHQGYWDVDGRLPAWEFRPEIIKDGRIHFVTLGDNGVLRDLVYFYDTQKNYRDGRWHMMTVITDGTFMEGFMDGVQSGIDNSIGGPDNWTADQPKSARKVGALCYYGHLLCKHGYQYFDGAIDNYRMYNRALSREEITALYNEEFKAPNHEAQGEVAISGEPLVGEVLNVEETVAITDANGLGEFRYQWMRHKDGVSLIIDGATTSSYTVSADDIGYNLSASVLFADGDGYNESISAVPTAVVAAQLPMSISVLEPLSVDEDTLISPLSFSILGDAVPLADLTLEATSDNQTLLPDENLSIEGTGAQRSLNITLEDDQYGEVTITLTLSDGRLSSGTEFNLQVLPINDPVEGNVLIIGEAQIGETLTAQTSALHDADGIGALQYQWLRDGVVITGETAASYTVLSSDDAKSLSVEVSYTDDEGMEESIVSEVVVVGQARVLDWGQLGGEAADAAQVSKTASASDFNGATPAQAGVSGGAASYHIPIVIPPGRNGVQPNVALNYSSRSGNGIAGVGFSLSASSSITRCPATVAQDNFIAGVDYTATDRLCLDGQRLVLVGGTYGNDGATYRTEIESLVSVTQSGDYSGAASFTV
ncbi:Ig-like domain-containing protein, partial [Alteromonas sp. a30]|uniref:Ig-like domain-containing protein n=1 Tax=Alteromonas sp. a30 TaxID=2730917 RepID=UPI00228272FA